MQDNDTPEIISNFGSPDAQRCGAKTRSGVPCRNLAVRGMKRCRMHGGKSYKGFAHPNFKHGWYSDDFIFKVKRDMVRDYRRREKLRRKFDRLIEGERIAREAKEARKAKRRKTVTWNADALKRLFAVMTRAVSK
jgi:hypothetical protein